MKGLQITLSAGEIHALVKYHRDALMGSKMPTVASDAKQITARLERIERFEAAVSGTRAGGGGKDAKVKATERAGATHSPEGARGDSLPSNPPPAG
jgi:hypothetical protein